MTYNTQNNQSGLTVFQSEFKGLLATKKNALENFLGNQENALKFMSSVMHCLQTLPALEKCSRESLMGAFMECASANLFPSNYRGDCYVLPYKGKAQFQLGYRGVKTLAFRSGILRIGTEVVYENDYFSERLGTEQILDHKRAEGDRGKAIGAYAWCEITKGNTVFKYMTESQIMEIKNTSQAKDSDYSPWNSGDPEYWMWQKTALKQLGKLLPTSDAMDRAIYLDNVSERGGYIEGEGEIVDPTKSGRLEPHIIESIKNIDDLDDLSAYYSNNKGLGKEFDRAIIERRGEIQKLEAEKEAKNPSKKEAKQPAKKEEPPVKEEPKEVAKVDATEKTMQDAEEIFGQPASPLENSLADTVIKSINESKNLPDLEKRVKAHQGVVSKFNAQNKEKVLDAVRAVEENLSK